MDPNLVKYCIQPKPPRTTQYYVLRNHRLSPDLLFTVKQHEWVYCYEDNTRANIEPCQNNHAKYLMYNKWNQICHFSSWDDTTIFKARWFTTHICNWHCPQSLQLLSNKHNFNVKFLKFCKENWLYTSEILQAQRATRPDRTVKFTEQLLNILNIL